MTELVDYRAAGVNQVNKWIWSKLQALPYLDGLAFGKYADAGGDVNYVPIVPSQQIPDMTEIAGGAPFIVYNYTVNNYGEQWWQCEEQVAYVIYDDNEARLRIIHNYLIDLLKRMDWTAREINAWLWADNEPGTSADHFDFKYVEVVSGNGPDPFTEQGGRQGAMVVCQIGYVHDIDGAEGAGMRA